MRAKWRQDCPSRKVSKRVERRESALQIVFCVQTDLIKITSNDEEQKLKCKCKNEETGAAKWRQNGRFDAARNVPTWPDMV
jgi:hypothetical protein